MSLSRDEAREVAATAIMLTMGLRLVSGIFRAIEEVQRGGTRTSVIGQALAPIGATLGILALGLALLLVLSPQGSISIRSNDVAVIAVGLVTLLGAVAALNELVYSLGPYAGRLWRALHNGSAAAVLGGTAWWILRNFNPER